MRSLHHAFVALSMLLATLGCASATQQQQQQQHGNAIGIRIANTVTPPRDVEIYLVEDRGTGMRLGTLRQSETRTFRVSRQITARNVRLVGRSPGRSDVSSAPFEVLPESGTFSWNMSFIEVEPGASVPR